jgi:hypothetical protein
MHGFNSTSRIGKIATDGSGSVWGETPVAANTVQKRNRRDSSIPLIDSPWVGGGQHHRMLMPSAIRPSDSPANCSPQSETSNSQDSDDDHRASIEPSEEIWGLLSGVFPGGGNGAAICGHTHDGDEDENGGAPADILQVDEHVHGAEDGANNGKTRSGTGSPAVPAEVNKTAPMHSCMDEVVADDDDVVVDDDGAMHGGGSFDGEDADAEFETAPAQVVRTPRDIIKPDSPALNQPEVLVTGCDAAGVPELRTSPTAAPAPTNVSTIRNLPATKPQPTHTKLSPNIMASSQTHGDVTLGAIIRLVLNTRDDVGFARFLDGFPKLPKSAFKSLIEASRASRMPIWPTIMSFVMRIQLGGDGYRPDADHHLFAVKPAVVSLTNLISKLQDHALEEMAVKLNEATASQQTGVLVKDALGEMLQIAVKAMATTTTGTLSRQALARAKTRFCHNAALLIGVCPLGHRERLDTWVLQSIADLDGALPICSVDNALGSRTTIVAPDDAGNSDVEAHAEAWFSGSRQHGATAVSQLALYQDAYALPPSPVKENIATAIDVAPAPKIRICLAQAPRLAGERIGDVIRWDRGIGDGANWNADVAAATATGTLVKRKRSTLTPVKVKKPLTKRRPGKTVTAARVLDAAGTVDAGNDCIAFSSTTPAVAIKSLVAARAITKTKGKGNSGSGKGKKSSRKGSGKTVKPLSRGQKTITSLWGAPKPKTKPNVYAGKSAELIGNLKEQSASLRNKITDPLDEILSSPAPATPAPAPAVVN